MTTNGEVLYCEDVVKLLPADCAECGADKHDCCSSCHEDVFAGYSDLLEIDLPDGRRVMLCCHMHTVVQKHLLGKT